MPDHAARPRSGIDPIVPAEARRRGGARPRWLHGLLSFLRGRPPHARIYPALGGAYDLGFARVGGPGLGNQLLNWARARVLAERLGGTIIDPAWSSIKIGPMLRGERDQRRYGKQFRHGVTGAGGWRKLMLFAGARRLERFVDPSLVQPRTDAAALYVNRSDDIAPAYFDGLWESQPRLCEALIDMIEPAELDWTRGTPAPQVAVHVRFGDFKAAPVLGGPIVNTRLPLEWYLDRISAIRAASDGKARFVIFSDASDAELGALLACADVRRQEPRNALTDMLGMARASLLVCSASTFSMWAAFLGRMPSLWHPGALPKPFPPDHSQARESALGEALPAGFLDGLDAGGGSAFEALLRARGPQTPSTEPL